MTRKQIFEVGVLPSEHCNNKLKMISYTLLNKYWGTHMHRKVYKFWLCINTVHDNICINVL